MSITATEKRKAIKRILGRYKMFKVMIENIDDEIDYFDRLAGTPSHDDAVDRERLENHLHNLQYKRAELQTIIKQIDLSMKLLTDLEKESIISKYVHRRSWQEIGAQLKYSGETCRQAAIVGLNKMADVLYLSDIDPSQ